MSLASTYHRGQKGKFSKGYWVSGRVYGYKLEPGVALPRTRSVRQPQADRYPDKDGPGASRDWSDTVHNYRGRIPSALSKQRPRLLPWLLRQHSRMPGNREPIDQLIDTHADDKFMYYEIQGTNHRLAGSMHFVPAGGKCRSGSSMRMAGVRMSSWKPIKTTSRATLQPVLQHASCHGLRDAACRH